MRTSTTTRRMNTDRLCFSSMVRKKEEGKCLPVPMTWSVEGMMTGSFIKAVFRIICSRVWPSLSGHFTTKSCLFSSVRTPDTFAKTFVETTIKPMSVRILIWFLDQAPRKKKSDRSCTWYIAYRLLYTKLQCIGCGTGGRRDLD